MSFWKSLAGEYLPELFPKEAAELQQQRAEYRAALEAAGLEQSDLVGWRQAGLDASIWAEEWKQSVAVIAEAKAARIRPANYKDYSEVGLKNVRDMRLLIDENVSPDVYREYRSEGVTRVADIRLLHEASIRPYSLTEVDRRDRADVLATCLNLVADGMKNADAWRWASVGAKQPKAVRRLDRAGVHPRDYGECLECGITDLELIVSLSRARVRPLEWISVGVRSPHDMIEFASLVQHQIGPSHYRECIEAGFTAPQDIRTLLSQSVFPKRFLDCGISDVDCMVRLRESGVLHPDSYVEAGVNAPEDMISLAREGVLDPRPYAQAGVNCSAVMLDLARRGIGPSDFLSFVDKGLEEPSRIERLVAVGCTADFWSELSEALDDDSIAELASIAAATSALNRWPAGLLRKFGLLDPAAWRRFAAAHEAAEARPSASDQHVSLDQLGMVLREAAERGERHLAPDEVLRRAPGFSRSRGDTYGALYSLVKDEGWDVGEAARLLG